MTRFRNIKTRQDLYRLVEEIGFLPLFSNEIHGFSVMECTYSNPWWSGDVDHDPWQWRMQIAAEGRLAYGKLFHKKAGFISLEWYPHFANYRRQGYDFDALYEEGKAPRRSKLIMDLFESLDTLPSFEIKRQAGFGRDGEKGFEGVMTNLQMQTYLTLSGFQRRRNKAGDEYGWPVGSYATPESLFGYNLVRSQYQTEPADSFDRICRQCAECTGASMDAIQRFLK
jgi:hypothetical protein